MSLFGAFDQTQHLGELLVPLDSQKGVLAPATRQALAVANLGITATAAQLNTLGVTAGVVAASKAVVVDANKDIGTFRYIRATKMIEGFTATSDATTGPRTYTAAEIMGGIIVRDTNGASRSDVLPTAALLVAAVPNATVGDVIRVHFVNGADAAEVLTLGAGSGGGFDTNQTAASRVIGQNVSKDVYIRLTNVTASSEAYVVYM